jgi:hypothetical protein
MREFMTRMSKQSKRRAVCPKRLKCAFAKKTGPKEDNLKLGYKVAVNAVESKTAFIPKVK